MKKCYRLPTWNDGNKIAFAPEIFKRSENLRQITKHFQRYLKTKRRISQVFTLVRDGTTYLFGRLGRGDNSTILTLGTIIGEHELFLLTDS